MTITQFFKSEGVEELYDALENMVRNLKAGSRPIFHNDYEGDGRRKEIGGYDFYELFRSSLFCARTSFFTNQVI